MFSAHFFAGSSLCLQDFTPCSTLCYHIKATWGPASSSRSVRILFYAPSKSQSDWCKNLLLNFGSPLKTQVEIVMALIQEMYNSFIGNVKNGALICLMCIISIPIRGTEICFSWCRIWTDEQYYPTLFMHSFKFFQYLGNGLQPNAFYHIVLSSWLRTSLESCSPLPYLKHWELLQEKTPA